MGAISANLDELEGALDKEYFNLLSCLGINKHIMKPLCTLPTGFLGFGLLDIAMEVTIANAISHLNTFAQHFRMDGTIGHSMKTLLEYLQLEIGSNKCLLVESYVEYGFLAT